MTWVGPMGGAGGGLGGGPPGQPQPGLPFAGIPSELQDGVDVLLAEEPDHGDPTRPFSQIPTKGEDKPLTLWGLLTEYPWMLLLAGALVVATSVLLQAGPKLTQIAIDNGMLPGHKSLTVVAVVAAIYLFTVVAGAGTQRALVMVTGRIAAWVMNDLRIKIFTHLQRLSLDFFTSEKAGVIMTRMTSDIENLQQLLQDGLSQLALQVLTMVVIAVVLFTMNVELALLTLVLVVPLLTAMSLWFRSASERGYDRVRDGIAAVMADLSESLHGVRVVTAYNRQRRNIVRHRNIVGQYRDANNATAQMNGVYGPGTQLQGVLAQAVLLGVGGNMVLNHSISPGTLVAFFLYLNRFFQPITLLVQQYNTFQQGHASIFKLRTFLSTPPSVIESATAGELPPVEGEIVFDDVSFEYEAGAPVLHDVNLRIAPGETVAFVGPTGAGKSTIAKLITRFYDPSEGRVLIDGHDLRSVTLESLRRQIGVVPQEPFLFAGSLRENITFAKPDAPDELVEKAIEMVGLGDLVEQLPQGADTVVHERGQALSSGERQLIALARAFLAQPRVLVLDEATSNLDLRSETKIESALDALLQQRTAVLIAHRLSTAMKADRIVVVDDGRIAEIGTHDELVNSGGLYASMYETWIKQSGEGVTSTRALES
ncbi:MAG TPA: ABC transporter ATP-binding protein [Acidimicrobiales bacterium]|nr:ABC transporter ATP-binding protein [Acidimicrobiales bacterium]